MNSISTVAVPRVLVPITVEALVVTLPPNATTFSVHSVDLRSNYKTFGELSPRLFSSTERPKPGVYINWALPDGMTRGHVNDNGRVSYPYLPNRWMVTRFSANPAVKTKAWVIESDWLGDRPSPRAESANVKPQFITSKNGDAQIKFIGRALDLDGEIIDGKPVQWREDGETAELILTAVGNSDPLFGAYTGNNAFVYSFVDSDFTDNKAQQISYMVTGWFANKAYDVMYNKPVLGDEWKDATGWMKLMSGLKWSVGSQAIEKNDDLDDAVNAGRKWLQEQGITPDTSLHGLAPLSLCHGLVFDIKWPGIGQKAPSSVPVYDAKSESVTRVSAGNTATDSLAAFMQWQLNYNSETGHDDREVEVMLQAFNQKMLNQPGGIFDTPELTNAIREAWYGRSPGGLVWEAQAPSKEGQLTPEDKDKDSLAPLSKPLAVKLAKLNEGQANYDKNYRELVSLQKQLYADWLKLNLDKNSLSHLVPRDVLENALATSLKAVQAMLTDLDDKLRGLEKQVEELKQLLEADGNFVLLKKPAPDFHQPTDPVFLLNNAGRKYKRGEDNEYSQYKDFLFVRFSGQFITDIKIDVTGSEPVTVYGKDICRTLPQNPDLPPEIPFLFAEACLLDINFAETIARKATADPSPELIAQIAMKQTLIWNDVIDSPLDKHTIEKLAGFNDGDPLYRIPSLIGIKNWAQPWNPLYLEWEVGYIPTDDAGLSDWEFNGTDYEWKKGTFPEPTVDDYLFQGRSILTPKEAMTFRSRLSEFLADYHDKIPADFVPLQDVLNAIGHADVLSQTITGFTAQLMHWDLEKFGFKPQDEYAAPIADEAKGMVIAKVEKTGRKKKREKFFPVRAGFLNIRNLWVVDDFGQVFNLMPNGSSASKVFKPVPALGMRSGDVKPSLPNCIQLPPRLVQGSRLNFNFLSAGSDAVPSGQSVDISPVCGWVLPNHLNRSIMVYNNAGDFIGETMLMGASGSQHAQWLPAPFDGVHAADIPNDHLRGFIQGLLHSYDDQGTPESGPALERFMETIDKTMWSVDPLGERSNQSLSVLVGRPIAVVRAAIDLELYGLPGNKQSWTYTGDKNGDVLNYNFSLQIGSLELGRDGVMGYFANDDYRVFNSVHENDDSKLPPSPYVVNRYTTIKPQAAPTKVTLLLDPRGNIHTTSGILPVLEINLPELYIGKVLDRFKLEFKAGPTLVDKKMWWMPLPAGVGQEWSWLQPTLTDGHEGWAEIVKLVPATAAPLLSDSPKTLVEGRLKLTGAMGEQLLILYFEADLKTNPYKVKPGDAVRLSWASQNAVSATIKIGSGTETGVPVNATRYPYIANKTENIVLTVKDAAGGRQQYTIRIETVN